MRSISYSGQFKRDVKKAESRGKNIEKLKDVIRLIVSGGELPARYRDHPLKGEWVGYRDIHIEPDWLLLYMLSEDAVRFERTGTHSELFG